MAANEHSLSELSAPAVSGGQDGNGMEPWVIWPELRDHDGDVIIPPPVMWIVRLPWDVWKTETVSYSDQGDRCWLTVEGSHPSGMGAISRLYDMASVTDRTLHGSVWHASLKVTEGQDLRFLCRAPDGLTVAQPDKNNNNDGRPVGVSYKVSLEFTDCWVYPSAYGNDDL